MSRKPTKGYYVKGHFVAEGSELDLELKRELRGDVDQSRTDLKKHSDHLQSLGEQLLTLRKGLIDKLALPDRLLDAIAEAKRITNFEGRRRQLQYVGKLMRHLDEATRQAARDALQEQRSGSAQETLALHAMERWRDDLIASDETLQAWIAQHPDTDVQQLRALIRQARKDAQPTPDEVSRGLAPRRGRAYRELFQYVREHLDDASE